MMELVQFISQDQNHFFGACIILGIISESLIRIILAFRGKDADVEEDEEE